MSNKPAARVATDTVAVADLPEAKTSTVAPSPKALPAAKLRFELLRDTLRDDCRTEADEETNLAAKEAFARTNECLDGRMRKARVDHLIAARPDAARRSELLALEDANDNLAGRLCGLSEEIVWVNFETGERDWGSLNGYMLLGCEQRAAIERSYFMKTMAAGDVAGLAVRIRAVQETGQTQRSKLIERRDAIRALFGEPAPDPIEYGPVPMSEQDRHDFVARIDAVLRDLRHHATDTCTAFPKLSEAFGDDGACEAALASYYASIGRFDGEMFGGSSDDD